MSHREIEVTLKTLQHLRILLSDKVDSLYKVYEVYVSEAPNTPENYAMLFEVGSGDITESIRRRDLFEADKEVITVNLRIEHDEETNTLRLYEEIVLLDSHRPQFDDIEGFDFFVAFEELQNLYEHADGRAEEVVCIEITGTLEDTVISLEEALTQTIEEPESSSTLQ